MRTLTRVPGSLLLILALTASTYPRDQSTTNENVLSRARTVYYSLARKNFKGFSAAVEPNWDVILGNSATPASLKIFRAVQFSMVLDEKGAVTVTHEVGPDAAKADLQPTVNRIQTDVQRLVGGFFNTWRIFVWNSPFPETDIQVENSGSQYNLSHATQAGKVTITMNSELVITQWTVLGPTVKRTVKPQWQKTDEGLLLTGYKGTFEPLGDGIKTILNFNIEYQDVSGMKVPYKVRLGGTHGSEPVEAELVFRIKSVS